MLFLVIVAIGAPQPWLGCTHTAVPGSAATDQDAAPGCWFDPGRVRGF